MYIADGWFSGLTSQAYCPLSCGANRISLGNPARLYTSDRYASFYKPKTTIMRKLIVILFVVISATLKGQSETKIEEVKQLGEEWRFVEAIELIKSELILYPENPELYYWLGRYSHFMVYDSRPFPGKNDKWSREQVLKNFQTAVELNPNYGDAKYFLAAEYGARALEALKSGDIEQYRTELIEAKSWGGFPLHAIEYGRNVLKSCDTNSILVVHGDAEANILQYVQAIEGYRKNVSIVIKALLERPYYVKLIRDGVPGIYNPLPINMSDNLIMEMHNYKWRENDVIIPVSEQARIEFKLNDTVSHFKWHIKPNVGKKQLWTGTAMLINIIETNNWKRPVHFTLYGSHNLEGLADNLQIVGQTAKLIPIEVYGTKQEYDTVKFETIMFNPNNYKDYHDIKNNDQPRVSYVFGQINRRRIFDYAVYLYRNNEKEKSKKVLEIMNDLMPPEVHPYSSDIKNGLKYLQQELEK